MNSRKIFLIGTPFLIILVLIFFNFTEKIYQIKRDSGWINYLPASINENCNGIGHIESDRENNIWATGVQPNILNEFREEKQIVEGMVITQIQVGCDNGLFKFDGKNWINFTKENSALPNNKIVDLIIDQRGRIWILTGDANLTVIDGKLWRTFTPDISGINYEEVLLPDSLAVDNQGNIWIGSSWRESSNVRHGIGLTIFNEKASHSFKIEDGAPFGDGITSISFDSHNQVMIATANEIIFFNGKTWVSKSDLPNGTSRVTAIKFDSKDTAWLGTRDGQVLSYQDAAWKTYNIDFNGPILDIEVDLQGRTWIAGLGTIYVLENGGLWQSMTPENIGLLGNGPVELEIDKIGHVWVRNNGGISEINPQQLQSIQPNEVQIIGFVASGGHWFVAYLLAVIWASNLIKNIESKDRLYLNLGLIFAGFVALFPTLRPLAISALVIAILYGAMRLLDGWLSFLPRGTKVKEVKVDIGRDVEEIETVSSLNDTTENNAISTSKVLTSVTFILVTVIILGLCLYFLLALLIATHN